MRAPEINLREEFNSLMHYIYQVEKTNDRISETFFFSGIPKDKLLRTHYKLMVENTDYSAAYQAFVTSSKVIEAAVEKAMDGFFPADEDKPDTAWGVDLRMKEMMARLEEEQVAIDAEQRASLDKMFALIEPLVTPAP